MILQKFFTDTLGGRFIKSLLAQTPVPTLPTVCDNDYIVKDCYYVYRDKIIKCKSSGTLESNYDIISLTSTEDIKTFSTYHSSSNYYDSETHYHLGRYLRYLKSTTGLNLLPFYNCYNANYINDTELIRSGSTVTAQRTNNVTKKVVAVPIKFNKVYTIAIDSVTEVLMCPVFRDSYGFIEVKDFTTTSLGDVTTFLTSFTKVYDHMLFKQPVKFTIDLSTLTDDTKRQFFAQRERYLYLLIQVDIDNESSVVVLEEHPDGIHCDSNSVRQYDGNRTFLLSNNHNVSFAFSDRLLEYLLNNVIHSQEWYGKNIAKVQQSLRLQFPEYNMLFVTQKNKLGIYDSNIPQLVYQLVEKHAENNNIYDQDGNINVDVERILLSKGSDY